MAAQRLSLILDGERAAKLTRLADHAHKSDGALAGKLLSAAIDKADPDAASVTAILQGIPDLHEQLDDSEAQVDANKLTELRDLLQ